MVLTKKNDSGHAVYFNILYEKIRLFLSGEGPTSPPPYLEDFS